MAEFKISTLLMSLVLVGLFVSSFGMLISNVAVNYGATYNDSDMNTFNKMNELNNLTEELKVTNEEVTQKTGVVDILGDFFSAGYKSIKLSFKSIDIVSDVGTEAVNKVDMGGIGSLLNSAMIALITIVFIVGIVVSTLVKRET